VRDQIVVLEFGLLTEVCVSPETHCHANIYPAPDPPEAEHTTGGSTFTGFVPLCRQTQSVSVTDTVTGANVVALAVFD
jgi:hypothetical protein